MLRAFRVYSKLQHPLTVVAADAEAARNIFDRWVEHHRLGEDIGDQHVTLVSLIELAMQPQLTAAVAQGVPAVLYWLGHRSGWWVTAPHEPQLGAISPPEPALKCFAVDDEAEEELFFAHSEKNARAMFELWNAAVYGDGGENATIREVPRWLLQGPQVTLREDMDLGIAGIGAVSQDGFWHIYHPESERELES